jgi:hypothetical protein
MNKYRVGVWSEESVAITVEAENEEQAKRVVESLLEDEGGSEYSLPHENVHRDFHVVNVQEKKA